MSKKKDLAILVSGEYVNPPYKDDLALKEALERMGCSVHIIAWDDQDVDFGKYHTAIIRSCWDYDKKVSTFLNKVKEIDKQCLLLNPFSLVKENSDKRYLEKLKAKGVPIVPTLFMEKIEELKNTFQSEYIIVKPTISASGRDTHRFHKEDLSAIEECCKELLLHKKVMIQPYISSVEKRGERSTVVIDGIPTFTMQKTPKEGGYLVHTHWGGTYVPAEPTKEDIDFLEKVIEALDQKPLYMRVDYVYDENDQQILLELEMIEPNLYLSQNEKGLNLLAEKLSKLIQKQNC